MALAKHMMGGGLSAGSAHAILGTVNTGLTATGTTSADAYAINNGCAIFGTVASGTGAILPSTDVSDEVYVYNGGANVLKIYPDASSQINQLSANSSMNLATNTAILFKRISSTRWIALMSA